MQNHFWFECVLKNKYQLFEECSGHLIQFNFVGDFVSSANLVGNLMVLRLVYNAVKKQLVFIAISCIVSATFFILNKYWT